MITVFFAELDAIELLMLPEFQMLPKSTSSLLDVRNLAITLDLLRALIYWLLTYAATLITVKRMHSSILIREIFTPLCFFETKDNGRKFINTHQLQELLLEADQSFLLFTGIIIKRFKALKMQSNRPSIASVAASTSSVS